MSADKHPNPFSIPVRGESGPFDFRAASVGWSVPMSPLDKGRSHTYFVEQLASGLHQSVDTILDLLERAQNGDGPARSEVQTLGHYLVADTVTTVWCRVQRDENTSQPTLTIMADLMDTYGEGWF